jgi:hypothetical protein
VAELTILVKKRRISLGAELFLGRNKGKVFALMLILVHRGKYTLEAAFLYSFFMTDTASSGANGVPLARLFQQMQYVVLSKPDHKTIREYNTRCVCASVATTCCCMGGCYLGDATSKFTGSENCVDVYDSTMLI